MCEGGYNQNRKRHFHRWTSQQGCGLSLSSTSFILSNPLPSGLAPTKFCNSSLKVTSTRCTSLFSAFSFTLNFHHIAPFISIIYSSFLTSDRTSPVLSIKLILPLSWTHLLVTVTRLRSFLYSLYCPPKKHHHTQDINKLSLKAWKLMFPTWIPSSKGLLLAKLLESSNWTNSLKSNPGNELQRTVRH